MDHPTPKWGPHWFVGLLLGCSVGDPGPAEPSSLSAQEANATEQVARQAAEVERIASELTAMIDESRRSVQEGRSTKDVEIEKMMALISELESSNAALQTEVQTMIERMPGSQVPDPTATTE